MSLDEHFVDCGLEVVRQMLLEVADQRLVLLSLVFFVAWIQNVIVVKNNNDVSGSRVVADLELVLIRKQDFLDDHTSYGRLTGSFCCLSF